MRAGGPPIPPPSCSERPLENDADPLEKNTPTTVNCDKMF